MNRLLAALVLLCVPATQTDAQLRSGESPRLFVNLEKYIAPMYAPPLLPGANYLEYWGETLRLKVMLGNSSAHDLTFAPALPQSKEPFDVEVTSAGGEVSRAAATVDSHGVREQRTAPPMAATGASPNVSGRTRDSAC
jgi:hypothetical protein